MKIICLILRYLCFCHQSKITVMLLQPEGVILSVQKELVSEIPFVLKNMVKPFHHDLEGRRNSYESPGQLVVSLKMPLMQEAVLCQILKFYKLWELITKKKYTDEYGATTATSLRQKVAYHSTVRVIIADS